MYGRVSVAFLALAFVIIGASASAYSRSATNRLAPLRASAMALRARPDFAFSPRTPLRGRDVRFVAQLTATTARARCSWLLDRVHHLNGCQTSYKFRRTGRHYAVLSLKLPGRVAVKVGKVVEVQSPPPAALQRPGGTDRRLPPVKVGKVVEVQSPPPAALQRPSGTDWRSPSLPPISVGIHARLRTLTGQNLIDTIQETRQVGVQYDRENFAWEDIEPRPGVYHWSATDAWVGAAASQGLKLIAIPSAPPAWATSSWNVAPVSEPALSAYAEFVRALVARYGSLGTYWSQNPTIPKVPIEYYDIWDEPYAPEFWGADFPDPAGYAEMFREAVEIARPADPSAKFMLEADTTAYNSGWPPVPFLSAMFTAVPDLAKYADVVSVHPYQEYGAAPTVCNHAGTTSANAWQATVYEFCRIRDIRNILDTNGAGAVPIWITEIGWSTAPSAPNTVTEAQQALYLSETFNLLQTEFAGLVQGVVWYELKDQNNSDPTDREGYFGLERANGSAKPALSQFVTDARDLETGLTVP